MSEEEFDLEAELADVEVPEESESLSRKEKRQQKKEEKKRQKEEQSDDDGEMTLEELKSCSTRQSSKEGICTKIACCKYRT